MRVIDFIQKLSKLDINKDLEIDYDGIIFEDDEIEIIEWDNHVSIHFG